MNILPPFKIGVRPALTFALAFSLAFSSAYAGTTRRIDAKTAFARMKSLAGNWSGPKMMGQRCDSAVLETCFEGTPMEMVTVYYPVGNALVQTHYCMLGNQPHMKLNTKKSSADTLVFDFAGGDNIKQTHMNMHATTLHFVGRNKIESTCTSQEKGRPAGTHTSTFTRA